MITITYENLMMMLALFTALCVAGGWLLKIIKGLKKPADDIASKLDNDNQRIKRLRKDVDYNLDAVKLLMRSQMAVLNHLQTGNSTGEMAKVEHDIKEFLLNN